MAEEPRIEELDKLIAKGKQKGFLTYDEVNDALPSTWCPSTRSTTS